MLANGFSLSHNTLDRTLYAMVMRMALSLPIQLPFNILLLFRSEKSKKYYFKVLIKNLSKLTPYACRINSYDMMLNIGEIV